MELFMHLIKNRKFNQEMQLLEINKRGRKRWCIIKKMSNNYPSDGKF